MRSDRRPALVVRFPLEGRAELSIEAATSEDERRVRAWARGIAAGRKVDEALAQALRERRAA